MIPLFIQLGPLPIYSFGLAVACALVAGTLRLDKSFARLGLPVGTAERYVMWAGVSGIVGARLWFIGEHWNEVRGDLLGALFANAGFTFYGGFLIAAVVLALRARLDRLPFARFCDSLGPCLALGYAIGRLGCQLSGDGDYGIPTTSAIGMSYETGTVPTPPGVLVYPTPLFESALSLMILWVLNHLEVAKGFWEAPFRRFGAYLALISVERFIVEFYRPNPPLLQGLSEAQVIAITLALVGVVLVLKKGASHQPSAG